MQKVTPPTDRTVKDTNVILFVSDRLSTDPPSNVLGFLISLLDFSVDGLEVHGIAILKDTIFDDKNGVLIQRLYEGG